MVILGQQLSWKLESADDLEGSKTLLSSELITAINRAQDVFCVGTASSEGGTPAEELRAARRAVNLAEGLASGLEEKQKTSLVVFSLLHHYSRSDDWLNVQSPDHP